MSARRARRGSALIDALVALVVLAIAGTSLVTLLGQTTRSIVSVSASERQSRSADDVLRRLAIMSRGELGANVGARYVGQLWLRVDRVSADLFDVSVAASDSGMVLLRTTLYRRDTTSDASR